ncbi:MAG: MarC family protein [Verrucomicrobiota bacterium]
MSVDEIVAAIVIPWAVIDPIGTVPVFVSVTKASTPKERKKIALIAALTAVGILLFFIVVGEILLEAMGVPLTAFQISGGLILFLFALTMIFGESKPESDSKVCVGAEQTAIFPLATPSIASPGAIMAVVLLTENTRTSISNQAVIAGVMMAVVLITYLLMLAAGWISKVIGEGGASVVSRVMGLILASVAATNVLEGIKLYYQQ